MTYSTVQATENTFQSPLNGNISRLYQHFLAGDIEPLEFSELLDDLIGLDTLINAA